MRGASHIKKFTLGEHLVFIPARRELINDSLSIKIKLQVPASLCLQLLLQRKGEVVSQEEIIIYSWGEKRSSTVSTNAYYQCILHIRKSLATMGLSDIIVTVPRQGLKINDDIPIAQFDDENENSHEKVIDSQATVSPTPEETALPATLAPLASDSIPPPQEAVKRALSDKVLIIFSFFIIISSIPVVLINLLPEHKAFQDYGRVTAGKCTAYISDKNINANLISHYLKHANLMCDNNTTLFVTSSPMNTRLNLIYCSTYSTSSRNCRSFTIMKQMGAQP